MRVVGQKNRCEIELDPAKAWQRARAMDGMFKAAQPALVRGVFRAGHAALMQQDALRRIEIARRLNSR
ncbi:MAG: hypothetical protein ACKVOO_01000 [Burkholderiaceae bacterium]